MTHVWQHCWAGTASLNARSPVVSHTLCIIVLLTFSKCLHILTKSVRLSILFIDSVMGMQWQLSKNMRDNAQIGKHVTSVFPCMHKYWWQKGWFFKAVTVHPVRQIVGKEEVLLKTVNNSPATSVCRMSHQSHSPLMSVWKTSNCHSYYPLHWQIIQALKHEDYHACMEFCGLSIQNDHLVLLFCLPMRQWDAVTNDRNSYLWNLEIPNETKETHFCYRFSVNFSWGIIVDRLNWIIHWT